MSLTLAIPFYNQLHDTKGIMALLAANTSKDVNWLIIDNGSTDPVEDFFYHTLRPPRLEFIKNPENIGMVATYQQIFDVVDTDLVAILHNDVFVYEKNWDRRVRHQFETINSLGSLGFFGSQGVGTIGERIQDTEKPGQMSGLSNMLEAETHGIRLRTPFLPAAILDGFAMVFNMDMIKRAGGIDTRYHFHHLYDRDLPLTSLALGYKNIILNVPCHHQSGVTANRPEYQQWINKKVGKKASDTWTHDQNTKLFTKKWGNTLPLYLESDFTFRKGNSHNRHFQGDNIIKQGQGIVESTLTKKG
jgi:GT2 family glycosyltransferase